MSADRQWGQRSAAAGSALVVGLLAAGATPASQGGALGPLMVAGTVSALVFIAKGRAAWSPLIWGTVTGVATFAGRIDVLVAVRLLLCGFAGSALLSVLETRRPAVRQAGLALFGAVILVADGAVGPRLGPHGGAAWGAIALASALRLVFVGVAVWLAFRRQELEDDEGLNRVALFLQGVTADPVAEGAPELLVRAGAGARSVRERVLLEQDQAVAAQIRIREVALKVRHETDLYQNGAAEQVGALSETSMTNEQLLSLTREVGDRLRGIAQMGESCLHVADGGVQTAQEFSETVNSLGFACQAVAERLHELRDVVQRIAGSLDHLFRATNRADVLALSAELEAANAEGGEARFVKVAVQMREMGEVVSRSMAEIGPLLGQIRAAVRATTHVTDLGVSATRRGSALASSMAARLDSISKLQASSVTAVKEVALLAERQELRAADLTAALSSLQGATRNRTQAASPLVAAGRSLESLARHG